MIEANWSGPASKEARPRVETISTIADVQFPETVECAWYRRENSDLESLSDDELLEHYRQFGEAEGRRCNALFSREDFAGLIPAGAEALEIGPFFRPLLRGSKARYFDVLTRPEMLERATLHGFDGSDAPEIDYVSPSADLRIVDATFDCVLSSHCIEHQPNLIGHLQEVERLLRPSGCYFLIVPDKRYCFDHFIPESTLPQIIQAFHEKRTLHSLASVLEHRALVTHNDSVRHWMGDHGVFMEDAAARARAALEEFYGANGSYIDVHAWYFTPQTLRYIFPALYELQYTGLRLERLYPTRRDSLEFWFILRKLS